MSEQQLSPVALRVAAVLVALLVVGVVVASLTVGSDDSGTAAATTGTPTPKPRTGPVALVAVDAPAAGSPECAKLTAALPDELPSAGVTLSRLPLADPAPEGAVAWGAETGEPVVLRCGLTRPPELTPTSSLSSIDKVQWLRVQGAGAITWYTVDRDVYIALTAPEDTGTGPMQDISNTVATTLKAVPVRTR